MATRMLVGNLYLPKYLNRSTMISMEDISQESDWTAVRAYFRQALYEEAYLDEHSRTQLDADFWKGMSSVLTRNEVTDPGVTKRVFIQAEAISDQVRATEREDCERTIGRRRGRAFLHGFLDPFAINPLEHHR